MNLETELDKVQAILHDSGSIWTRAELLRWWNDGYQKLVGQAQAVRRWSAFDVPGRVAYSLTYPWEDRHANGATVWATLVPTLNKQLTTQWEAEHLVGVTPNTTLDGITQPWERSHSDDTNRHFRFALARDHDHLRHVFYDDEPLTAVSVRELDATHHSWMRDTGDVFLYTPGVGRVRTLELFEIETTYRQAYEVSGTGIPRSISGSRTYTASVEEPTVVGNEFGYTTSGETEALGWHENPAAGSIFSGFGRRITRAATSTYHPLYEWEEEHLDGEDDLTDGTALNIFPWEALFDTLDGTQWTFPLGLLRGVRSEDRQYWPVEQEMEGKAWHGKATAWHSTVDNLSVVEVVTPRYELTEDDTPDEIPTQLLKYIRWYTLSRAFGHDGEGHQPELAQHFDFLFQRGVRFFARLGDVTRLDRVMQRDVLGTRHRRIPRPRLPSTYPVLQ